MTAANFARCMPRILVHEGGWSNHPADPGGVTLEGVIQRVYDGYRRNKGLPTRPLTAGMRYTAEWIAERDEIYRRQYWNKVRGDQLPAGVDYVVFDGAVNSGPVQSIKWLQRALGVPADGELGEATMAAIAEHQDHDQLVADICARRMAFLRALRTFPTFGKGWTARVSNVKGVGQAWATGSVGPMPRFVMGGEAKASPESIAAAPVSVGKSMTGTTASAVLTGTVDKVQTSGLMEKLQEVSSALEPLSGALAIIGYVLVGITVIGAGLTLYGIYRDWKAQRARNGEDVYHVEAEEEAYA